MAFLDFIQEGSISIKYRSGAYFTLYDEIKCSSGVILRNFVVPDKWKAKEENFDAVPYPG